MYRIFIFLMLMSGIAQADVYVLTNSTDNTVIGLSEQNDMVTPTGTNVSKINGTIANLPINTEHTLYYFNNGNFNINTTKVKAKQDAQEAAVAQQTALQNAKASAISKLKALGLTDSDIQGLIER